MAITFGLGPPSVTTGASSLRSVTARFSPPSTPRSITTDWARRDSNFAVARFSASPPKSGRRQLAAWRSVRKMTSFRGMVETSRTRSIAPKLATRSVPPWGMAIESISLRTADWLAEGEASPTTTRGGSAIRTMLNTSPRRVSRTNCAASALARSNRVFSADEYPMLKDPSSTITRCVRCPGSAIAPRLSKNGLAIAETTSKTTRVRIASSNHCSTLTRRWFFRSAATRNRMAAHRISRYFRRFSKWIRIGNDVAAIPNCKIGRAPKPSASRTGKCNVVS